MTAIATIGFGEAAQAFIGGWREDVPNGAALSLATYDIKLESQTEAVPLLANAERLQVLPSADLKKALEGRGAVFSMVTADRAFEAAAAAAPLLEKGTLYLDCNSCSPFTKQKAAALIDAAGGRYVDVAVMAPVYPKRHKTPLLVAGAHAETALALFASLDMKASFAGDKIGQASSIKMLRSVMIKGFEALSAECFLAARRAGVEDAVLASLQASDPGYQWRDRVGYNLERMMVHGKRRAAEMREVAATLSELGLPNRMAQATVDWQADIGNLGLDVPGEEFVDRADAILTGLAHS